VAKRIRRLPTGGRGWFQAAEDGHGVGWHDPVRSDRKDHDSKQKKKGPMMIAAPGTCANRKTEKEDDGSARKFV